MINRFSSRRHSLTQDFLAKRLKNAKSYKRIAGYFRSSIFELVGEEIAAIPRVQVVCNSDLDIADIAVSKHAREIALKDRLSGYTPTWDWREKIQGSSPRSQAEWFGDETCGWEEGLSSPPAHESETCACIRRTGFSKYPDADKALRRSPTPRQAAKR